jgi:uncharacterized protein involved in exopolysaccharide biosynthesis
MSNDAPTPEPFDFLEILLVLARDKKLILQITLCAAVLALIVVFVVPKTYTATATLLPTQQNQSVVGSMLGQIAESQTLDLRNLGMKNPSDVFVVMLRSRTIEDALINRFDLRKAYNIKRYEDTRKKLEGNSDIESGDEGLITITVTDRDARRAADVANAWGDELRNLNQSMAFTEAAQRRLFFEQKLAAERDALSRAEFVLKQIEQKTGIIQPDTQTRYLIGAVADVRAQIAAREVQLQSMSSYATPNNPDVKRLERELAEMRSQFARLSQLQSRAATVSDEGNLEVPTGRVAGASLEYLQAARELRYHESLYDFLSRQLEAARIDEAKNAVLVQVVDKAVVPEKKSGPKRMVIVLVSAGAAFVLACLGVLFVEALRRKQQDPNERARLASLRHSLNFGPGSSRQPL